MVQMNGERVVSEDLERFVVMAVHVPDEEIKHRHVHQVQQSTVFVVRGNVTDHGAVVGIGFPLCLPALVVRPTPGMTPHFSLGVLLSWEEGSE